MFRSFSNTWQILKTSYNVLIHDKELLFFPVISGILSAIFVVVGSVVAVLLGGGTGGFNAAQVIVALLIIYIPTSFVVTFFSAALIAGALERIKGGDPTLRSSMGKAWRSVFNLFLWSLVLATVSLLMNAARRAASERSSGLLGILAVLGVSAILFIWELLTFFVIPVILEEKQGPISSMKRSLSIVRSTWGTQITAGFGFGIFYILVLIPAVVLGFLLFLINPIVGVTVPAILFLIAIVFIQALSSVFKAALYHYAVGGTPQEPEIGQEGRTAGSLSQPIYSTFSPDVLRNAYRVK